MSLHSIANEIWASGRRAVVVPLDNTDAASLAGSLGTVVSVLGPAALVVRCEAVVEA